MSFKLIQSEFERPDYYNPEFCLKNNDDIFMAYGKIMMICQEWEQLYRNLIMKLDIETESGKHNALGLMNKELLNLGKINNKQYEKIREVIHLRNKLTHLCFLEDSKIFVDLSETQEEFNMTYFLICEVYDTLANILDEVNSEKNYANRPSIFNSIK